MNTRGMSTKRQGGFTLVEMAIVLIIIGLIIGAVLKGQDLIVNARAKQFANFVRQAEVAAFAFYDRNGRWPGDTGAPGGVTTPNGIIGDETPLPNVQDIRDLSDTIKDFESVKRIGSETYYVFFATWVNAAEQGPAIIVSKTTGEDTLSDGTASFNETDLEYCKAMDTAIDGFANAQSGKVVALDDADIVGGGGPQSDKQVIAYDADGDNIDEESVLDGWATSHYGLLYLFDSGSL